MGVLRIILEDVVTDMKMRKIFVNETSPIIVQKHAHCYGVFKKIQFYEGTTKCIVYKYSKFKEI